MTNKCMRGFASTCQIGRVQQLAIVGGRFPQNIFNLAGFRPAVHYTSVKPHARIVFRARYVVSRDENEMGSEMTPPR